MEDESKANSWENSIENQLSRLEYRVFGNGEKNTRSKKCTETLININSRVNLATTGRDKVTNVFKKIDELEKYLENESAGTAALSENAKIQLIVSEENSIIEIAEQLQQIQDLKSVLNSEHLKGTPQLNDKFLKLSQIQITQQDEAHKFSEEVKKLIDSYNGIINTLTKQFIYWDDLITNLEMQAQKK